MKGLKSRIMDRVSADLTRIECALENNLNPELPLVNEVARHILFSGGKRMRPLIMVLSARLCGYADPFVYDFSTIFEYLHTATLLHDDLVDGAAVRRNKPVAHSIWGNSTAVLVGDFLLARALAIAASVDQPRIVRTMAHVTAQMSQGEIHQLDRKGNLTLSEEEYLQVIRRKTAVLFEGACRISANLANAPAEIEAGLADYGLHLGLAFQMADDLLDYTADLDALGKEAGADLREGKMTLPLIHAFKNSSGTKRAFMEQMILNADFSTTDFKAFTQLLHQLGGIDYVRERAAGHVAQAKNALMVCKASEDRETLFMFADYALARHA